MEILDIFSLILKCRKKEINDMKLAVQACPDQLSKTGIRKSWTSLPIELPNLFKSAANQQNTLVP